MSKATTNHDPDYWIPTGRSSAPLHTDKTCTYAQNADNLRGVSEAVAQRMSRKVCHYCNESNPWKHV